MNVRRGVRRGRGVVGSQEGGQEVVRRGSGEGPWRGGQEGSQEAALHGGVVPGRMGHQGADFLQGGKSP